MDWLIHRFTGKEERFCGCTHLERSHKVYVRKSRRTSSLPTSLAATLTTRLLITDDDDPRIRYIGHRRTFASSSIHRSRSLKYSCIFAYRCSLLKASIILTFKIFIILIKVSSNTLRRTGIFQALNRFTLRSRKGKVGALLTSGDGSRLTADRISDPFRLSYLSRSFNRSQESTSRFVALIFRLRNVIGRSLRRKSTWIA